MSQPLPLPKAPAGRTYAASLAFLGTALSVLLIAGAWGLVRNLNLPSRLPAKTTPGLPINPNDSAPLPLASATGSAARSPLDRDPGLLERAFNVPPEAALGTGTEPGRRTNAISDPVTLELVEVAVALKQDGDTAGALQKLREADKRLPNQGRILWELASVYNQMALPEKADQQLTKLRELGPVAGGEFFQLAELALEDVATAASVQRLPDFAFGKTVTTGGAVDTASEGETVTVRMAIHSRLGKAVKPEDIGLIIEFYDLVDGARIEETRSDIPTSTWPTAPVDWGETGTEIVEWRYHMPELSPEVAAQIGKRSYYGYVARLYYKDRLQDLIAEPRTLFAREQFAPSSPMLDASLFPAP